MKKISFGILGLGLLVTIAQPLPTQAATLDKPEVLAPLTFAVMMSSKIPREMGWCDSCWNSIAFKEWTNTLQAGDGTSRSATNGMFSFNAGYGKVFVNVSLNLGTDKIMNTKYSGATTAAGDIYHAQTSEQIGYAFTPEFSLAVGLKNMYDSYFPAGLTTANGDWYATEDNPPSYVTVGASYAHQFSDKFSINGVVTSGSRQLSARNDPNTTFTGQKTGTSNLLSYEVGCSYAIFESSSLNFYYREEQWDALLPTSWTIVNGSVSAANLVVSRMKLSGPGIGFTHRFD